MNADRAMKKRAWEPRTEGGRKEKNQNMSRSVLRSFQRSKKNGQRLRADGKFTGTLKPKKKYKFSKGRERGRGANQLEIVHRALKRRATKSRR